MRKTTDRDLARTALEKHAGIKGVSVDHGDVAVARLARRTGLREGMVEVLRWVMETGTVLMDDNGIEYLDIGTKCIKAKLAELGGEDG